MQERTFIALKFVHVFFQDKGKFSLASIVENVAVSTDSD